MYCFRDIEYVKTTGENKIITSPKIETQIAQDSLRILNIKKNDTIVVETIKNEITYSGLTKIFDAIQVIKANSG